MCVLRQITKFKFLMEQYWKNTRGGIVAILNIILKTVFIYRFTETLIFLETADRFPSQLHFLFRQVLHGDFRLQKLYSFLR